MVYTGGCSIRGRGRIDEFISLLECAQTMFTFV